MKAVRILVLVAAGSVSAIATYGVLVALDVPHTAAQVTASLVVGLTVMLLAARSEP